MTEAVIIESTHEVPPPSRKRQVTATVVTVGLTIGLGMLANIAIDKITTRIKDKIAPQDEETE